MSWSFSNLFDSNSIICQLSGIKQCEIAKVYKKTFLYTIEDRCETGENNEATQMRRSKLERYVDILALLTRMGPLKLTHIMYKSNFNGSVLKEYLDFLIKQGLIEERTIRETRSVFAVTQRGRTVLKHFRELTREISAIQ
jgi:predicted transcriptional regulator